MPDDVDARVKKDNKISIHAYSMSDGFTYIGKKKGGTSGRFNELVTLEDMLVYHTKGIIRRTTNQNGDIEAVLKKFYRADLKKGRMRIPVPINTLQAIAHYIFSIEE